MLTDKKFKHYLSIIVAVLKQEGLIRNDIVKMGALKLVMPHSSEIYIPNNEEIQYQSLYQIRNKSTW